MEDVACGRLSDQDYREARLVELTNKLGRNEDLDAAEEDELATLKKEWIQNCREKLAIGELSAADEASLREVEDAERAQSSPAALATRADRDRMDALFKKREKTPLEAKERVELRRLVADDIARLEDAEAEYGLSPSMAKNLGDLRAERAEDAKAKAAAAAKAAKKRAAEGAGFGQARGAHGDARDPARRAAAYRR